MLSPTIQTYPAAPEKQTRRNGYASSTVDGSHRSCCWRNRQIHHSRQRARWHLYHDAYRHSRLLPGDISRPFHWPLSARPIRRILYVSRGSSHFARHLPPDQAQSDRLEASGNTGETLTGVPSATAMGRQEFNAAFTSSPNSPIRAQTPADEVEICSHRLALPRKIPRELRAVQ